MARNLWEVAKEMAEKPTFWQRIKHSKRMDPLRRYQGDIKHKRGKSFGKRVLKGVLTTGVSKTFQLIPIPVVKDITSKVYDKVCKAASSYSHKRNLQSTDIPTKAKFALKELDVSDLDRFRWKITDAMENFNRLYKYAHDSESSTASICTDYGKAMSKFYYCKRRIGKMEVALEGLEEAVKLTRDWLKEVDPDKWPVKEDDFKALQSQIEGAEDEKHEKCSKYFCVKRTDKSWSKRHSLATDRISKGVSLLVDVSAPDFTDKGLYGTHDKGPNKGKSSYFTSE